MRLQYKILLAFVACFALAFSGLLIMIAPRLNSLSSDLTENLSLQIVEARAGEIGAWLIQRVSEAQIAARVISDKDLNDITKTEKSISAINGRTRDGDTTENYVLAFADADGMVSLPNGSRLDVSEREYFQSALASTNSYVISKALVSYFDSERAVIICYPIKDQSGSKTGYLLNQVPLSMLTRVASSIRIFDAAVWVMDRYGRIIAQDGRFTGAHVQNPENYFLNGTATSIYTNGTGMMPFQMSDGSQGQLLYTSIPNTDGWHLCVLATHTAMYGETSGVIRSVMVVWVALIGLSVALSAIVSMSVVKPINQLSSAMVKVGQGDLHIRFEQHGGGEIARLGDGFNNMLEQIERLMNKVYEEQRSKRKAELRALQSQINPHFLYNTLDTLVWMATDHNDMDIADMLSALSNFFRISLSKGMEYIPLRKEIEHVYSYLFIQQIRYSDRLNYDISIPDESVYDILVPKLILQPIIENAIYHGIKLKSEPGTIQLEAVAQGESLVITVSDNGMGMEPDKLRFIEECLENEIADAGYGLYNVDARLRLAYGARRCLFIDSVRSEGCVVRIVIPKNAPVENYVERNGEDYDAE